MRHAHTTLDPYPPPHADKRRCWSGKHKCHGLLVVVLTDERCRLLLASAVRPASLGDHTRPP
jgi:hypothetical protein